MSKSSNKKLYLILFLSILFILQAFIYETDTCSPCNAACFQDTSYIELVYQPDPPDVPQITNDSLPDDTDIDLSLYALQQILIEELDRLRLREIWESDEIIDRDQELPSRNIISILKKKNNSHQSSDDEPLPHIYS